MTKTDGGTKVIHTIPAGFPAVNLVTGLNNSSFSASKNATGFVFGALAQPDGSTAITATGPWHLPGSQRPAHGTMQTWAQGYAACLMEERPSTSPSTGLVGDPQ